MRVDIHIGDKVFEDWGTPTLKISEGVAIEKAYGKTFTQFTKDLGDGSMYAMQVLVWSLLRRDNPELKVSEVDDISFGDVSIVTIPDESAEEESDDPFTDGSSDPASPSSNPDATT